MRPRLGYHSLFRPAENFQTRFLKIQNRWLDRAEFHWRLGVPLTLLVLTVLAVPLARTEPRKGRFAGLGSAVLVYLIYANLLAAGRGWLARDQVPEVFGLWWVHGLFLVLAGLMLFVQQGLWLQWRRRFWPRESVA